MELKAVGFPRWVGSLGWLPPTPWGCGGLRGTLQELGLALTPSLRALLRRCDGDVAAVLDQLEDSPVP